MIVEDKKKVILINVRNNSIYSINIGTLYLAEESYNKRYVSKHDG